MPNIINLSAKGGPPPAVGHGAGALRTDAQLPDGTADRDKNPSAVGTDFKSVPTARPRLRQFFGKLKPKWYLVGGLIVAIAVIVVSFALNIFNRSSQPEEAKAAWFNDSWHYRASFDVFSSSAASDFQLAMSTSTLDLLTAWSGGKLNNDFSDLRFTDVSGNLLDYWFPSATSTLFYVYLKLPQLPANATTTVFMYYGNSAALEAKIDPAEMFPDLYEDFSDGDYTTGNHVWQTEAGTYSVTGSSRYLQANTAGQLGTPSNLVNGIWEFDAYSSDANAYFSFMADQIADGRNFQGYQAYRLSATDNLSLRLANDGTSAGIVTGADNSFPASTWVHVMVKKVSSAFVLYVNGQSLGSGSNATFSTSNFFMLDLSAGAQFDNLWFRQALASNPVFEQTAGTSEEAGGGPVGYWSFNEGFGTTAYDSSGSGNNGTLTNMSTSGTSTAWITGKVGKALQFDGVNDYVARADTISLSPTGALTLAAWINTNSIAEDPFSNNSINVVLAKWDNVTNKRSYVLGLNYNLDASVDFGISHNGSDYDVYRTGSVLEAGKWYHLTATYDGDSEYKIYLNGLEQNISVAAVSGSGTGINDNNAEVRIGNAVGWASLDSYFDGQIDEPKVYHYVISQEQILAEYNKGVSVMLGGDSHAANEGLVGYWPMDESTTDWDGTGDRVNDYSGNGLNGTVAGGAHATTTAKYGNAGEFDGTGDYVDCGNGSSLNLTQSDHTIESWIRPGSNNTDVINVIVGMREDSGVDLAAYGMYLNASSQLYLNVIYDYVTGNTAYLKYNTALTSDQWYHIAGVRVGNNPADWKLYINGTEVTDTSYGNPLTAVTVSNSANFRIGGRGLAAYSFDGLIDDLKVYNTARTADQIMADYLQGPSPIASYDFEEGSGTTLYDKSGQGYNGAITAGASNGFVKGKAGRSYDFDGANTTIPVAEFSNSALQSGFTISAWIKPDSVGETAGRIIDKTGDRNGLNGFYFIVSIFGGGTGHIRSNINNGIAANSALSSIVYGVWQHALITITSGGVVNIYLNGVLSGTANQNTNPVSQITTANPLTIGNRSSATDRTFDGAIDDLKVYNYVLTPWQIAQEYNNGAPMAAWSFDDGYGTSAYDQSGNLTGTLTNMSTTGTSTVWITGKFGKGVLFDGTNDTVTVADGTGSGMDITGAGSLSAWIKPADVSGSQYIVDKDQTTAYALVMSDSTLYGYFDIGGSNSCSGGTIAANQWQHVMATYDGSYIRCFINGQEVGKTADTGSIDVQDTSLYIGSDGGAANYFNGLIDEVKIYHYALSPQEIKRDINEGKSVVLGGDSHALAEGLVAWWPMDESTTDWDGTGDRVNDYSGNGLNGTSAGDAKATTTAKYGNAGEFDGTGDYVTIVDNSSLDLSDNGFTVSFWIKTSNAAQGQAVRVLTKNTGSTANFGPYTVAFNSTSNQLRFGYFSSEQQTVYAAIEANVWLYYTGVYDKLAGKLFFYKNGELIDELSVIGVLVDNDADLTIGSAQIASSYFDGLLDDVKIYSTARTADQIMADYLQGPSPIAFYDFEEGSGTTLYDKSGQGYNGAITAGTGGYKKGKIGRSYDFDGTTTTGDTKIDTGSDWIGTQAISVSVWVYPESSGESNNGRILDNGNFLFIVSSSAGAFYAGNSGAPLNDSTEDNSVQFNTWQHVVVTRTSEGLLNFYINSQLSGSANQDGNIPVAGTTNVIIGNNDAGTRTFDGHIDDLKVYNYVLTPWQIAQEYNGGAPIAYWKLDEGEGGTIYDWSDNSYNGTLSLNGSPATSTAWQVETNCKKGKCLDFDGTDDTVTFTDTTASVLDLTTTASISAWIKPADVSGSQYILDKDQTTAYALMMSGSTLYGYFDIGGSNSCSGGTIAANQWQHVMATYDGSYIRCYINGVEVGKTADTGSIDVQDTSLYIGSDGGSANYFNGLIDEMKVYNYALSLAQIREDYNAGFGAYFK